MKDLKEARSVAFEVEVIKDIIKRFDSLKHVDPLIQATISGDLEKIKYDLMCIEDTYLEDR